MRDAFCGTPLWGIYMTDILKNLPEVDSSKVKGYIRDNPGCLNQHCELFDHELSLIGAAKSTLVALGGLTRSILKKRYAETNSIITIKHYSSYISADNYREHVRSQLTERGLLLLWLFGRAAARTYDDLWRAAGHVSEMFVVGECAYFFGAAGYELIISL